MALNTIVDDEENIKKFLEQMSCKAPSRYVPKEVAPTFKADEDVSKSVQKEDISPQLSGLVQPPNTPQVIPDMDDELTIDEIKSIIHSSVKDVLGVSKRPAANLSQSMHAPRGGMSERKPSASKDGLLRGATQNNHKQSTEPEVDTVTIGRSNKNKPTSSETKVSQPSQASQASQTSQIDEPRRMATNRTNYIPPHLRGLVAESGGEHEISVTIESTIEHKISIRQKTTSSQAVSTQTPDTASTNAQDAEFSPSSHTENDKNEVLKPVLTAQGKGEYVPPHLRKYVPPHFCSTNPEVDSPAKTSADTNSSKPAASQVKVPSEGHKPNPILVGPQEMTATESAQGPATTQSTPTPSSIVFEKLSPGTVWENSRAAAANPVNNLEDAIFFGSWGKPMPRDRPAARTRKVRITNLPRDSPASFVASLVYGGPVESIIVGRTSASVLFVHADDCSKYYNGTANGIVYKKEGKKKHVAFVGKGDDPNMIGGLLRQWIDQGVTRCVAVRDLEDEWTMEELNAKAMGTRRQVESIEDGFFPPGVPGRRCVTFRFCRMDHAVEFMKAITINSDWEAYTSVYVTDPCELASDIHF